MLSLVLQVLWVSCAVAAAGILHMVAVKLDLWPWLRVPLDGGRRLRERPIFGPNKTWRGVVFMIVAAAALGVVQGALCGSWAAAAGLEVVDFELAATRLGLPPGHAWGYGVMNAVFGLGYALGELPNSFLKRQLDIEPGKTTSGAIGGLFLLVDQADSVVAALALGALAFGFSWTVVVIGTVCLSAVHLAINAALHAGGLRRNL